MIMITAVMANQMAEKTGAVVRNFFMAGEAWRGGHEGEWAGGGLSLSGATP